MVMPEDPVMLLSFVNMKLRDFYGSLDALCEECGVDKAGLVEKLKKSQRERAWRVNVNLGEEDQGISRKCHSLR